MARHLYKRFHPFVNSGKTLYIKSMMPTAKIDKNLNIRIFDGPLNLTDTDQTALTSTIAQLKQEMAQSLSSEGMKKIESTILQILELPIDDDIKNFLEGWLILYDGLFDIEESIKVM